MQERAHISFCPITLCISLFGKRTVQEDSCLHSEQIDIISVGGHEGGLGGGGHIGPEAQILHVTVRIF